MADNRIRIRVRVDDDTVTGFNRVRQTSRNLGRRLVDDFRHIGTDMGNGMVSMLNGQFGEGISTMAKNPYVAAGLAAFAIAAGTAIGAALAGAIVLAFGGAFVGLGVFLLAGQEEVKKKWGKTIGDIKKQFTEAAKPLLPVIEEARKKFEELATKFAPHFKKAMEDAAPHLTDFLDRMAKGIEEFGKKAWKPMMDAFGELLDEIDIEGFFSELGDAFKELADAVKDNKKEIGILFDAILYLVPLAIRFIAYLARRWGENVRQVQAVIDFVKKLWGWIKKLGGKTLKFGQKGLQTIVNWLKTAKRWVGNLKGKVVRFAQRGAQAIINIIRRARNWISGLKGKTVRFAQRGIQAIINGIRRLKNWIASIKNKTVKIAASIGSGIKKFFGFAHGGIVGSTTANRAAGGGGRQNQVMVGESGPEIVDLPPGSRVRSNADSRRMMGQRGGSGPIHISLSLGGKDLGELVIDPLKRTIKKRGGIQAALGS